jgi:hypothetical protein
MPQDIKLSLSRQIYDQNKQKIEPRLSLGFKEQINISHAPGPFSRSINECMAYSDEKYISIFFQIFYFCLRSGSGSATLAIITHKLRKIIVAGPIS